MLRAPCSVLRSGRRGQSLVEILVATAVGAIMILAAITVIAPALRSNTDVARTQAAAALAKELLDNVRVWAEADWHNLGFLATSSANGYFLVNRVSPFVSATGTETMAIAVSAASLRGHWKMDESSGTSTFDFSGQARHANQIGSPAATSGCQLGNCLSFNGSSAYLDVGTGFTDTIESAGSLTAWVYRRSNQGGIFSRSTGSASTDERLVVFFRSDTGNWGWSFANGASVQNPQWASNTFPANEWVHFALVWNGSSTATYLNGAVFDARSQSVTPEVTGVKTRLGWTEGLGSQFFDGYLDDVRVYSRALTASEVSELAKEFYFTRRFYLDTVGRDASGYIQASGGTLDPSTLKVTVEYGWVPGPTNTLVSYLTRHGSRIYEQSDWFGGPGQTGPATSTNSSFATSTAMDYSSSTGSIFIDLP